MESLNLGIRVAASRLLRDWEAARGIPEFRALGKPKKNET